MRLAWLTDIHLNFLERDERRRFLHAVAEQADAVAISGDVAEGHNIEVFLRELASTLRRPIYFVLGNHDFYRSSIETVRGLVTALAEASEHLVYLSAREVVPLSERTAIIGHDGWADGRCGDYDGSDVILNDYLLIAELRHWKHLHELDKPRLREALHALGDEAARHFERRLTGAAAHFAQVIAVTHVPPFREAAWYQGRTSDDNFLPHFACRAVGEALVRVMLRYPQCQLQVLCGHTHGGGELQVLDNLRVWTGEATYGAPAVQKILRIE
jgi:predicted MPP superfamily phosphohydrolase